MRGGGAREVLVITPAMVLEHGRLLVVTPAMVLERWRVLVITPAMILGHWRVLVITPAMIILQSIYVASQQTGGGGYS